MSDDEEPQAEVVSLLERRLRLEKPDPVPVEGIPPEPRGVPFGWIVAGVVAVSLFAAVLPIDRGDLNPLWYWGGLGAFLIAMTGFVAAREAMFTPRSLVSIRLPLSDRNQAFETLPAFEIGGDLYLISEVPLFAYGVRYLDVVRATPEQPGEPPTFREVDRPGGQRGLRLTFPEGVDLHAIDQLLTSLRRFDAAVHLGDFVVGISVDEVDLDDLVDRLELPVQSGLVWYELDDAPVSERLPDLS